MNIRGRGAIGFRTGRRLSRLSVSDRHVHLAKRLPRRARRLTSAPSPGQCPSRFRLTSDGPWIVDGSVLSGDSQGEEGYAREPIPRCRPCAAFRAPSTPCASPRRAAPPTRGELDRRKRRIEKLTVAEPHSTTNTSSASTSLIVPGDISHTPNSRRLVQCDKPVAGSPATTGRPAPARGRAVGRRHPSPRPPASRSESKPNPRASRVFRSRLRCPRCGRRGRGTSGSR